MVELYCLEEDDAEIRTAALLPRTLPPRGEEGRPLHSLRKLEKKKKKKKKVARFAEASSPLQTERLATHRLGLTVAAAATSSPSVVKNKNNEQFNPRT